MNSNFRAGLKNGDVLIGTLITIPAAEVAEIMIEAGFDWLYLWIQPKPLPPSSSRGFP